MPEKRFFSRLRGVWRRRPSWFMPLALFLATCCTTTFVGYITYSGGSLARALWFSAPLMTILSIHELGHYLQLKRYRIDSTLPYFLPVPIPPLGTFGAIIRMRQSLPNRRALFDVGVSGPVAGLVASLVFLALGLSMSEIATAPPTDEMSGVTFGAPIIMRAFTVAFLGDGSDGARFVLMHPCAVAAWVGLFLTALNLIPVGQLDGGHAIYALLGKRSTIVSVVVLVALCVLATLYRYWGWFVFVGLLAVLGFRRYATRDDTRPLGAFRTVCGWALLAYLVVGFTPSPMMIDETVVSSERSEAQEAPVLEHDVAPGPLIFHIGQSF
ncbi:MAG: site-2 protease family protein [Thermoguttaceae bacterium]|jgi:membrane-associated protease RseP (regulator of RpoE activity)